MRRLIEFKCKEDAYVLEENNETVFSIKATDLKFNAVDFYCGVYKNKTPIIELVNTISVDSYKKGKYIFDWLSDIVSQINNAFPDMSAQDEPEDVEVVVRLIHFYEFAACAGDGFVIDSDIPHEDVLDPTGRADFAVKITGDSMEPTIKDGSTIYVRITEELQHNDIGLFVVDGDVMCKRFIKQGRGYKLVPDNDNGNHKTFSKKDISTYKLLGKVIL